MTTAEGNNLLQAYKDAIGEQGYVADINNQCLTAMENLKKRVKLQELLNSEEILIKIDQDMAEVKNHLGHSNEDIAPLSVPEQLIFVNT